MPVQLSRKRAPIKIGSSYLGPYPSDEPRIDLTLSSVPKTSLSVGKRRSPFRKTKKSRLKKLKELAATTALTTSALSAASLPTTAATLVGATVLGPVGALLGSMVGIGGTAAAIKAIVSQSKDAYKKYYTYKNDIDSSRMGDVLFAAEFMLNAYSPNNEISGWSYQWINVDGADIAFFAEESSGGDGHVKNVVFSFRGTVDLKDALADANSSHAKTINKIGKYSLHIPITAATGFLNRVKEIWEAGFEKIVTELLLQYEEGTEFDNIFVTGHSLGGAAATIFAVILGEILPSQLARRITLITFEPARSLRHSTVTALLADPDIKEIAKNAIFITNGNDPVPQVPLAYGSEVGASGFRHFGVSWFIPADAINAGYLSAHGSSNLVQRLKDFASEGYPRSKIYESNGYGIKRIRKTRTTKSKYDSKMMKARMAYVRSFKKK